LFQTTTTDPMGRLSRVIADVDGRPIETASKENGIWHPTTFTYGPNDKMWIVTDPKGHATVLESDLRGRRAAITDPDAGTTRYRYNGYGEIREEIDALGQKTEYQRDAMGRRRQVTNADGVTSF